MASMHMDRSVPRRLGSSIVFLVLVTALLWFGTHSLSSPGFSADELASYEEEDSVSAEDDSQFSISAHPDFNHYIFRRTLSSQELGLDDGLSDRRLIVVGDVHGMKSKLDDLLSRANYNATRDTLVHLGDTVTRGQDTPGVLEFMATNQILGVRGNQDQKVIGWRAWQAWVESKPRGKKWLRQMEKLSREAFEEINSKEDGTRLRHDVPLGWEWQSEHYWVARNMTPEHYLYLLSLPLVLHIPSLHTFLVHAGLLPSDPRHSDFAPWQPLAHAPVPATAKAQEHAILRRVPQNQDAWVLLNIRSVKKNGKVSRKYDGTPWSELWNRAMARCAGFALEQPMDADADVREEMEEGDYLPCKPSSVIYAHAAGRELDLKRWTIGLDSGCVYGKKLSGLVMGGDGSVKGEEVVIGKQKATLISVNCS